MTYPTSNSWNALFQIYSICTLILFLLYEFCIFTSVNPENRPQEDHEKLEKFLITPPNLKRKERIHANNLENLPFNVLIFWMALLVQNYANMNNHGANETNALKVLFITYTVSRVFYVVAYRFALQPWRSLIFTVGLASVLGAAILMVISAFYIDIPI